MSSSFGNGTGSNGGRTARFANPDPGLGAALAREAAALQRDWDADERDRVAERRDERARQWDAERAGEAGAPPGTRRAAEHIRASGDRAGAARDRAEALRDRVAAALDRAAAALDRDLAADERVLAAIDQDLAADERVLAALDQLTWGPHHDPGIDAIEREIERGERTRAPLSIACVRVADVEDRVLHEVADVLRTELRAYDLVVCLSGDEFACILAGADSVFARARFAGIVARLRERWHAASFEIGFARLEAGDSWEALVQRAGADLLARRAGDGAGS